MKAYLDNSATTRVADEVLEAMRPYFLEKYGNASSFHHFGDEARKALENARMKVAKSINALPEEIVFTSGGSESNNLALRGLSTGGKNHLITSRIEHPSVLGTCKDMESAGLNVTYLGVDGQGFIDQKFLENSINDHTFLVSVMHANNEVGTIQDIQRIGSICRKKGVFFHTDAVQSYTRERLDVKAMNIDLMSLSSHKIHGPKGIGALYVRKGIRLKKQITGGRHEHNLRAGTENVPGAVGFAKAASLSSKNKEIKLLRNLLIKELLKIDGTTLNGAKDKRLCNNANISFANIEGESILLDLAEQGIAVSTGSACSSMTLAPSHVLMAMREDCGLAHGSIRFSLSRYTTREEIQYTLDKVKGTVERLRAISAVR